MKQLLLASTALVLGGQALAADMPLKAPAAVPYYFSWSGCSGGAHVGGGWSHNRFTEPVTSYGPIFFFPAFTFLIPMGGAADVDTGAGFLGGVQAGCDYQFASNWVIGAAGDFSWTDIHGQTNLPPDFFFGSKSGGPLLLTAKTEWLSTATLRLGYTWDRVMLFGRGGVAWERDKIGAQNLVFTNSTANVLQFCGTLAVPAACNPSITETHAGWTLGVGVEWAFADRWSAVLEYDHYDFGSRQVLLSDTNVAQPGFGTAIVPLTIKETMDAVKLGFNYRFLTGAH